MGAAKAVPDRNNAKISNILMFMIFFKTKKGEIAGCFGFTDKPPPRFRGTIRSAARCRQLGRQGRIIRKLRYINQWSVVAIRATGHAGNFHPVPP